MIKQPITETLESNYMPYAMSVIISRAIPEIDGFKPAHRKLLYTMYKMGLLNGARTKSANVVGQTMRLNPHGDLTIYETMVRLTEGNMSLLHPLVDSKGNFGKTYSRDMAYAASRYTEVKLKDLCQEVFGDIDKNTVEFIDNYDSTTTEPTLLPTKFPNILVNPNQGIAVGMASNMCSFNLKEVCQTTINYLKNEDCEILDTLLAPDFSTGGELLYNREQLKQIYESGRGTFKVRAKWKYDKKSNCIDVYEIPYTTTIEVIMDKIVDLIKNGKIREISDVRDETDLKGLKLTIDLKRGTNPDTIMAKLFKATPLMDSFGCNFNVLLDGSRPKVLGVKEILREWTKFRINCIKRQLEFDIKKKTDRLHLLQGLEKILLDIDKAVAIVRGTENDADVVPNLMSGFAIDELQAEYVADIKLRNLNKEYILNRTKDIEDLLDDIAKMKSILGSEGKIKGVIIDDLKRIDKKYGVPRRTDLVDDSDVEDVDLSIPVEDYALKAFVTSEGYFKKITLVSLRSSGEHKLKEGDKIVWEQEGKNKDELLVFTDKCNVYKMKLHEIADTKASQMGEYLPALMKFESGENAIFTVMTSNFKGHLLFCYENGKMAKIPLVSYETVTNRKKLTNAHYDKARLVALHEMQSDNEFVAISSNQKVLVFNTENINEKTTRSSQGVNVLTLKKGAKLDKVIDVKQSNLTDLDYYRTKNIPAVGCFLKKEDSQQSLF